MACGGYDVMNYGYYVMDLVCNEVESCMEYGSGSLGWWDSGGGQGEGVHGDNVLEGGGG